GPHVFHDLDADLLEGRSLTGEIVLEDPLGELLTHHRPAVLKAEAFFQLGAVFICRCGSYAVDHRVGEVHVLLEESTEVSAAQSGECREAVPSRITVALDVVARHDRERSRPALPAAVQGRGDETEGRRRSRSRLEVMHDVGVGLVEPPADRVEVVPALGDRERNDPYFWSDILSIT